MNKDKSVIEITECGYNILYKYNHIILEICNFNDAARFISEASGTTEEDVEKYLKALYWNYPCIYNICNTGIYLDNKEGGLYRIEIPIVDFSNITKESSDIIKKVSDEYYKLEPLMVISKYQHDIIGINVSDLINNLEDTKSDIEKDIEILKKYL